MELAAWFLVVAWSDLPSNAQFCRTIIMPTHGIGVDLYASRAENDVSVDFLSFVLPSLPAHCSGDIRGNSHMLEAIRLCKIEEYWGQFLGYRAWRIYSFRAVIMADKVVVVSLFTSG